MILPDADFCCACAAEGAVKAVVKNGVGAVVEVNAESDFVAKNDLFMDYVNKVAEVVADYRAMGGAEE